MYLMSYFVKLITQPIYKLIISSLSPIVCFHMLTCALIYVCFVNLTNHKQVEVYTIKIYLFFTTTHPPFSTFSGGNLS